MLNQWVGIGNLGHSPEIRYLPSGDPVCSFNMAVTGGRTKEGQEKTVWMPVVVFGKTAEACAKYLSKGSKVAVSGMVDIRSYEDKDGNKRKATEVKAQTVRFLDGKKTEDNNGQRETDTPADNEQVIPF